MSTHPRDTGIPSTFLSHQKLHALETLPRFSMAETSHFSSTVFSHLFPSPSSVLYLVGGKLLLFLGLGSVAKIGFVGFVSHAPFHPDSNLPMLKSGQFINHVGRISSSLKSCHRPKHMSHDKSIVFRHVQSGYVVSTCKHFSTHIGFIESCRL